MTNESRQHVHVYCLTAIATLSSESPSRESSSSIPTDSQTSRFDMSFEQAFEQLELLPQMFIELDGSFVWSGQQATGRWQIDGMLYDRDGRLQRVELAGHAPRHAWEQLLSIIGQPLDALSIHCLHQQRFIDAAKFLGREFG